ncbi:MAG: hypothetical protein SFV23_15395 [Planctomycetaceae bacterium]|nr:hypothetical protein [Planctomycetaceae bacterium]
MTNPLHLPADVQSDRWPGIVRPAPRSTPPTGWLHRMASAIGQPLHASIATPAGRQGLVLGLGLFLVCCGWSLRRTSHWRILAWYSRVLRGEPLESSDQVARLLVENQELGLLALIFGVPLVLLAVHDWLRGGRAAISVERP